MADPKSKIAHERCFQGETEVLKIRFSFTFSFQTQGGALSQFFCLNSALDTHQSNDESSLKMPRQRLEVDIAIGKFLMLLRWTLLDQERV